MFRGENATCSGCLAHPKKGLRIIQKKSRSCREHKEEENTYNQEYDQREVECEVCGGAKLRNAIG